MHLRQFADPWVMAFPPSCSSQGQDTSRFSSPASISAESEVYQQLIFHDFHATAHDFWDVFCVSGAYHVAVRFPALLCTKILPR